jgi:hypothetical protein
MTSPSVVKRKFNNNDTFDRFHNLFYKPSLFSYGRKMFMKSVQGVIVIKLSFSPLMLQT